MNSSVTIVIPIPARMEVSVASVLIAVDTCASALQEHMATTVSLTAAMSVKVTRVSMMEHAKISLETTSAIALDFGLVKIVKDTI